jgi:hypothetical protein
MKSKREIFSRWREELFNSESIAPLAFGASQEEVTAVFGAPDDVSTHKKKGRALVFRYADIEFHFDHQREHRLHLIYREREDGSTRISIKAP